MGKGSSALKVARIRKGRLKRRRLIRWSVVRPLHFYSRVLRCNTLPLSVRHLHPYISPARMFIDRLARRIGALTFEPARRYGRITECPYLHIVVFDTGPFGPFRLSEHGGLSANFPIGPRIHELVGDQWGYRV